MIGALFFERIKEHLEIQMHPSERPIRKGRQSVGSTMVFGRSDAAGEYIMESLILAQNERWRRVLSMQVGR
ncbi:MAG: hypothetical protein Ta2G_18720 [Termitinemataceae bacterium]|nr:MAG: hypothetical protein Ta2G_18720 [Termitinemataceae bacterium]